MFPILWEGMCLSSPNKLYAFTQSIKLLGKKDVKFDEWTTDQKTVSILLLGYWVWLFIGLFTFQWPVFLLFLLLGLIPKNFLFVRLIDSAFSLILLFFILINAYHLKIDVWNVIVSFFEKN